ncbi:MAG: ATP synthase F1 subunit gamma [Lachnospiraceae bacterium]|nr:ATP synthase F1 subunit gamma [Lachnospiraceae bacterium]
MAGLREIQSRIKSIQDTRKITNAMYMISSTKLRKARQELEKTEPYFYTLQSAIDRIWRHVPDMEHIYFEQPDAAHTKLGLLVVTGDKGLAGAYNHNVLKLAQQFLDEAENEVQLFVVGELGRQYFTRQHVPIIENFQHTVQNPTFSRARWITHTMLEKFYADEIDELHVIYTRMENGMSSVAEDKQLLPLKKPEALPVPMEVYQEEFLLEPSAEELVDTIVPNYIAGFVYGALVESFCSEQNARMSAMRAATDNADELLHDMGIMYNRARQAAITQEITEVSSGARALRNSKVKERNV